MIDLLPQVAGRLFVQTYFSENSKGDVSYVSLLSFVVVDYVSYFFVVVV